MKLLTTEEAYSCSDPKTDASLIAIFWDGHDQALFAQKVIALVRGCSESLLERERWVGKGPPFLKIGRQVRYRKSDVVQWLEAHKLFSSTSEYQQSAAHDRAQHGIAPRIGRIREVEPLGER